MVRLGGSYAAQLDQVRADADVEFAEKFPADRRGGDACGRLARRRTFENIARVVAVVFENAGEVGVSRANARDGALARIGIALTRRRVHDLDPVLPVAILDDHGDRRSERLAGAHTGEKLDG